MLNHPQLFMNILPLMTDAVTGASMIFAPIMGVFAFALLLLLAAWMISAFNQPPARDYPQTYFYAPAPHYPAHYAHHGAQVHHHPTQEHQHPRIHGHF